MNLEELRAKIDGIDDTLVQAFLQRMEVVAQVAQEKKAQGLPTLDPARETAITQFVFCPPTGSEVPPSTAAPKSIC